MPDTSTEVAIATTTLGSAASTITFSSIPATYTDLRLVLTGTTTSVSTFIIRYNSDTGSNYSFTSIYGNGSSAASEAPTNLSRIGMSVEFSSSVVNFATFDIFSYAGNTNKTTLVEFSGDTNGSGFVLREVALWRNTSAINRIDITTDSSTWKTGTTATLYGILKA
jgi:hypothetical protein